MQRLNRKDVSMDFVYSVLSSVGGSFAFVLAILFLAGYCLVKVTRWQCEMDASKSKVAEVSNSLDSIRQDIVYIKGSLDVLKSNLPNPLTQSHSPISLTERGKDVAEKMGIHDIVVRNWEKISAYIDQHVASKNAYDIQQFCIEVASISLDSFFVKEDVARIKNFAFESGQNIAYYGSMIGIIVRDHYFAMKHIDIKEVDANDPAKQ